MASSSFVLVTGASGYLGAHIVDQLVKEGHRVRGKVDVVAIDDVVRTDFTTALKDITAVIQVAAPVIGRETAETTLKGFVEGSTRVLRQGYELGIKHYAIVSSVAALVDPVNGPPGALLTDKDWNELTWEEAVKPGVGAPSVYGASKSFAEKEIWEFAEAHPEISVTTLLPTMFLDPNAPGQKIAPGDNKALNTNLALHNLLLPDSKVQTFPFGYVDVRDVAAGLIAGIKVLGRNRIPLTGEFFDLKEAVEYVSSVRPELKGRLATIPPSGQTNVVVDTSKESDVLGVKPRAWKDTVIQTIDYLLQLEKDWEGQGVDLESRLKQNEWRE